MAFYWITDYIINVKKKHTEPPMEEFKFHYRNSNSIESSDKYFLAHNMDEAMAMFDYACNKRHLDTKITEVYKWNRWLSKWEKCDLDEYYSNKADLSLGYKIKSDTKRISFEH